MTLVQPHSRVSLKGKVLYLEFHFCGKGVITETDCCNRVSEQLSM
jgi:hypothetical protein